MGAKWTEGVTLVSVTRAHFRISLEDEPPIAETERTAKWSTREKAETIEEWHAWFQDIEAEHHWAITVDDQSDPAVVHWNINEDAP